jgi:hypothetical protein
MRPRTNIFQQKNRNCQVKFGQGIYSSVFRRRPKGLAIAVKKWKSNLYNLKS